MPTLNDRVLKNSQRRETEARKSQKKKRLGIGVPLSFSLLKCKKKKKKSGGTSLYIIILKIINQTIKILSCITQQSCITQDMSTDENLGGKESALTLTLLDKSLPISGLSFSIYTNGHVEQLQGL